MEKDYMIDINSSIEKIGDEPLGRFEKFWGKDKQNVKHLVKYNKKRGTNEILDRKDVIEKIVKDVCDVLNLEAPNIELGYDKEKEENCCICENFLEEGESLEFELISNIYKETLIEFLQIIEKNKSNNKIKDFKVFGDILFSKIGNIKDIKLVESERFKKYFLNNLFLNCLVDNHDGNAGNVGLIKNDKYNYYRPSPIYDNGSSFEIKHEHHNRRGVFYCFSDEEITEGLIEYYPSYIKARYENMVNKLTDNKINEIFNQEYCKDAFSDKKRKEMLIELMENRNSIKKLYKKIEEFER